MTSFNGLSVKTRDGTLFVALPPAAQTAIGYGCECPYCKAHPDKTPMWDTLAVAPHHNRTWTVHYPEFSQGER